MKITLNVLHNVYYILLNFSFSLKSTDALSNIAIGGALLTKTGCSSIKQVHGCIKQFVSISHIDILPTHIDKSIEMNNIRSLPYAVQIQINI